LTWILALLFPVEHHALDVKNGSVAHHLKQIARRRVPEVDSHTSDAIPMALIAEEGTYIGTGDRIWRIL
jgi:hypothetical protein